MNSKEVATMIKRLLDNKILVEPVMNKKIQVDEAIQERKEDLKNKVEENKVILISACALFTGAFVLGFHLGRKRKRKNKQLQNEKKKKSFLKNITLLLEVLTLLNRKGA